MISETIRQKLEEFIKNNYIDYSSLPHGKIHYSISSVPPETILENKAPTNTEKTQQSDLQKDTSSAPMLEETISYSTTPTDESLQKTAKTVPSLLESLKFLIIDKFSKPEKQKTFASQLLELIKTQQLNEIDVYKAANIDRKLFSKIRHDEYHPSRKTAIALVLALRLSPDMAKDLLSFAGYALSSTSKTAVIIEFCLENQLYDLITVNELLQEYTGQTL